MAKPEWTDTQIINQLDAGTGTQYQWSGTALTYSFVTSSNYTQVTIDSRDSFAGNLTQAQQATADAAIALWDDLIIPDFTYTSDVVAANITYGNMSSSSYAYAFYPTTGAVWFNSSYASGTNNLVTPVSGKWGYLTYIHETGHALGLDHPGNYDGGSPTYETDALYSRDSIMYTVMSYFDETDTGGDWVASDNKRYYAQTPMMDDIMAIQAIYGAETTTRTDDTTYGFNSTLAGSVYDFSTNAHPVLCIYDAGGDDTLDLSGWSYASTINLTPGTFSSSDMMLYNLSIARNTWIENAIGGTGADSITGNILANTLEGDVGADTISGGEGNDTLEGGDGNDRLEGGIGDDLVDGGIGSDTAVFSHSYAYYLVNWDEANGWYVVTDLSDNLSDGIDYVLNIEFFSFLGQIIEAALAETGTAGFNEIFGTEDGAELLLGTTTIANAGIDHIYGLGGDDTLTAGSLFDTLEGGTGHDTYILTASGAGNVIEVEDEGTDTIQVAVTVDLANYPNVENATLTGTAAVSAIGSTVDNVLVGNTAANLLTGLAGNDSLVGLGGNDTLVGGDDADTLDGGIGTDSMLGGLGNDRYVVDVSGDVVVEGEDAGSDTVVSSMTYALGANVEHLVLTGSAALNGTGNGLDNDLAGNSGANSLVGAGGEDTLAGLGGNDTLDGGTGADSLVGGLGNDTYVVDDEGDEVVEASGEGTDTVQSSVNFTLGSDVEILVLTGGEAIDGTGNGLANTIVGNGAANWLDGAEGNDSLVGNGGNDTLDGGSGTDTLVGGAGDDIYIVDATGDVVTEGAGAGLDTVNAYASYTLGANVEDLILMGSADINGTGNAAANGLIGNAGNNVLNGLGGVDTVYYYEATSGVTVDLSLASAQDVGGEQGLDTLLNIENLFGSDHDDVITGSTLANVLTGGAGDDTLSGGAGLDTLVGGEGDDSMAGGIGDDTYSVDDADDVVVEGAGAGTDTVLATVSYTLGDNVEKLVLGGSDDMDGTGNAVANTLTGNAGANSLSGGGLNDTLIGNGGHDTLDGGTGTDSLVGGSGDDWYVVDVTTDVVVEGTGAGSGTDTVVAGVTYVLGANIENLELTGSGNINGTGTATANLLTGNDGNNSLAGLAGTDTLDGGEGNDTLDGGTGADSLVGGEGDDLYILDNALDVVVEEDGEGDNDTVQAAVSVDLTAAFAHIESVILTGSLALNAIGNDVANSLTGNTGANSLTGNAGNDSLSGLAGNDTLLGGADNDTLDGGAGIDSMVGGDGDDTYVIDVTTDVVVEGSDPGIDTIRSTLAIDLTLTKYANVENVTLTGTGAVNATGSNVENVLTGNDGANSLTGGLGDDTLTGGLGNDTLNGGAGADSMDGGSGTDWVTYAASLAGVSLDLSSDDAASGGDAEGDVLANIENVIGSGLDDTIVASNGANVLNGSTGTDVLSYASAASGVTISLAVTTAQATGGSGSDTIANFEALIGSDWNDKLTGSTAANTLDGGEGNDTLDGGTGADSLVGGAGDDLYILDNALDVVVEEDGEGDNDTVQAAVSVDLTAAFAHIESVILTGSLALNAIGNDVANSLTGNTGANSLTGNAGNDSLSGLAGNDTLLGGADSDTLDGGAGIDSMVGGDGDDVYVVDVATDKVIEAVDEGTDTVRASITIDLNLPAFANVENAVLTGAAALNATGTATDNALTGNDGANSLTGGLGADTLTGGLGNDTLNGGAGADSMDGGSGVDWIVYGTDAIGVILDLGAGTVASASPGTGEADGDAITANTIEHVLAGSGNDSLTGSSAANSLVGNAGNDTLDGGLGNDTMVGGLGDDTYYVNVATDVVTELSGVGSGTDTVISQVTYVLSANLENVTLAGSGTINATGNAAANVITGNAANNSLNGGSGNDTLEGGLGNDTIDGSTGTDWVTFTSAEVGISVDLSLTTAQATGVGLGSDRIVNIENVAGSGHDDTITGSTAANMLSGGDGNDTLNGAGGNDTLTGGEGEDRLTGGTGIDVLTGGLGNDVFDVNTLADSLVATPDTITDFETGDTIDLADLFASEFSFLNEANFTNVAGQLRVETYSTGVLVQADTNGDGIADFALKLEGTTLATINDTGTDFVL